MLRRAFGFASPLVAGCGVAVLFVAGVAAPGPGRAVELRSVLLGRAADASPGWSAALHSDTSVQLVGATWSGRELGAIEVRALGPTGWSEWTPVTGNPAEGPDAGTREDRDRTTAGPIWVGRGVHDVEVRVASGVLRDLRIRGVHSVVRVPSAPRLVAAAEPPIHPRTDWGQPEQWRQNHPGCDRPDEASRLRFAVVHHTDNGNGYAPGDVPALINGIWQFHVNTNGWCDIGYNFLVDRFGGVWEGRAGGIDRAIVGAHAGGFNTGSTGIAMLGEFSDRAVGGPMYGALVNLLAWKMGVHDANPTGVVTVTAGQFDGSRYPQGSQVPLWTIIGHRDVDQTDCPGTLGASIVPRLRVDVQRRMAAAQSPGGSQGYWLVASDGGVFAFGDARFFGSTGGMALNQPIVGMAATPSGGGYWLVASDGGVFTFGDARFFGSTGAIRLNRPVVGMAATPSGGGYWLVASDGGIFAFGDARFFGSTGAIRLNQPIVGMAATPSGGGYWLVASDGGVFTFGDAGFAGAGAGGVLGPPVAGVTARSDAGSYRFATGDGVVYSYGGAEFLGSPAYLPLKRPIVGVAEMPPPPPPPPAPPPTTTTTTTATTTSTGLVPLPR